MSRFLWFIVYILAAYSPMLNLVLLLSCETGCSVYLYVLLVKLSVCLHHIKGTIIIIIIIITLCHGTYLKRPCVTRGSHSFTCHPHSNRTCFHSSATRLYRPLAGTYCANPRRDGQAELTWVAIHTEINGN